MRTRHQYPMVNIRPSYARADADRQNRCIRLARTIQCLPQPMCPDITNHMYRHPACFTEHTSDFLPRPSGHQTGSRHDDAIVTVHHPGGANSNAKSLSSLRPCHIQHDVGASNQTLHHRVTAIHRPCWHGSHALTDRIALRRKCHQTRCDFCASNIERQIPFFRSRNITHFNASPVSQTRVAR